jgi:hypothetical protein
MLRERDAQGPKSATSVLKEAVAVLMEALSDGGRLLDIPGSQTIMTSVDPSPLPIHREQGDVARGARHSAP